MLADLTHAAAIRPILQHLKLPDTPDSNGHETPDCWQRGGFGSNTFTWTRTRQLGDVELLAQGPRLPSRGSYTFAEWTTPAAPSAARALSGGLSIDQVGTLTMDDFMLDDVDAASAP